MIAPLSRRHTLRLSLLATTGWLLHPLIAEEESEKQATSDWAARAEAAQKSIRERHWDEQADLFHSRLPVNPDDRVFDYWWQAQALDVLVDGYERTQDRTYLEQGKKLFHGIVKRNGQLTNDYYDDMLWLALALQRLHRHDADEAVAAGIRDLWKDIRGGWTEQHGGGISWCKKEAEYKSVPSNAPAVILACRLYRESKDEANLELATKLHAWLTATLVDPASGLIWDGINRKNSGVIDKDWVFSYNQGTYIGASLELHRVTGKQEYLDAAERTARAAEEKLAGQDGILDEGGRGDGGLFKGIFVRYLGELARYDHSKEQAHAAFILKNAESAWKSAVAPELPVFSGYWRAQSDRRRGSNELGPQISAIALLEQAAACARA